MQPPIKIFSDAEYEYSENKSSLSEWKDAAVSLAAFATSRGGVVRFGISPDGKRIGVQLGKNTIENLANDIRRHTDPPVFPSIQIDGEESSAIIRVAVEESPIKPVWAFGKPYKRVGRTNQSLTRVETQRLLETTTGRTWDAMPCEGLRVEHLSRTAIENFLKRSLQDISTPTETVIENLRLRLTDGALCNAAALLFATNLRRHITGAYIKCGRFRGDSPVDFLDESATEGNLFEQIEQSLLFVARNTRQSIKITGQPEREIISEYPKAAIREAIINAICHRDYAEAGHVQVRIFDTRLEISNPGQLPHVLSVAELYGSHHSHPKNRLVADAFYRARLIEHWGTGTLRIVKECEERGMVKPEFLAAAGSFVVRFSSSELPQPTAIGSPFVLADRQQRAVNFVQERGSITSAEYRELFKISNRQANYDLKNLVVSKRLELIGKGRSSRYKIP